MKKLFILPNLRTPGHIEIACDLVERLEAMGMECSMDADRCEKMYGDRRFVRFSPEKADLMVAIGGDGSVLQAAKTAFLHGLPLLGINSGRLGFLCALTAEEVRDLTVERLEQLVPTRRSLLSFTLGEKEFFSLNDVIIAKEHFGESIDVEVSVSSRKLRFCGDGVVIATPTGSTAYNLSAGGPVISYDVPALSVTPICPHGSDFRSQVVHSDSVVWVTLHRALSGKAAVFSDGVLCGYITDSLHVQTSTKTLTLLCKE